MDGNAMISSATHLLIVFFFPAAMAMAASMDLFTMTIPNRLCAALVMGYFVLALLVGAPAMEIVQHLVCGLAILALTFIMFSLRWIGGGDAKLAAATALWFGWTPLAEYGLTSALAGGALTLAILVARRVNLPKLLSSQAWIARLHDARTGIPYGIALAAAGLMIYPETQIWQSIAVR